jgi:hypothetical protein
MTCFDSRNVAVGDAARLGCAAGRGPLLCGLVSPIGRSEPKRVGGG